MNDNQEDGDEDATLQEHEVMASPDVEPVEDLEEDRAEAETEVEEEDRESDEIEEREDEMAGKSKKLKRRNRSRMGVSRRSSTRKRAKGQDARHPRTVMKRR